MKNIIFDVDGTLWDSARAVTESWNVVLSRHPETKDIHITTDDMYSYMGHTMSDIGYMMIPECDEKLRDLIMDECMEDENNYLLTHSGDFYPDLFETLRELKKDHDLYIVSNCQDGYIQTMMQVGDFAELITDFECYGRTGKQKGDNIKLIMQKHHLDTSDTVYVGDTAMDEEAANVAGIPFIHASYGFGTPKHPIRVIKSIADLPAVIKEI